MIAKNWIEANKQVDKWKLTGLKVVFTNGCFDILHRGHVEYLTDAKAYGDKLVTALNSDSSVRGLKGDFRPIQNQDDRAAILDALASVDLVVVFDEETPARLIETVLPDVLVKGGDYLAEDIVGYDVVTKNGGRVEIVPFVEGKSTSGIVNLIME